MSGATRRDRDHRPAVVAIGEVLWDMLPGGRQLGGAPANCAVHAAALGAVVSLVSRVGRDEPGDAILAELRGRGVGTAAISVDERHPTGRVRVDVSAGGEPRFTIEEPAAWDFIPVDQEAVSAVAVADAVCYGLLAQRAPVSRATVRACLQAARRDSLRVFDVNLRDPFVDMPCVAETLERSNVVKLNDLELRRLARSFGLEGDETHLLGELVDRYALRLVALTKGAEGSRLYGQDGDSAHPGYRVVVADTVGAGDAFTAALITGLLAGHSLDRINDDANRLASAVCSVSGACLAGEVAAEAYRQEMRDL